MSDKTSAVQGRDGSPLPTAPEAVRGSQSRRSSNSAAVRESSVYAADPLGAYHLYALSQEESRQRAALEGQQLEDWYSGILKQELQETVRASQRLARDNQIILDFAIEEVSRHDSQHMETRVAQRDSQTALIERDEAVERLRVVELHHAEFCSVIQRYYGGLRSGPSSLPRPPLEKWAQDILAPAETLMDQPSHLRRALTTIFREEAKQLLKHRGDKQAPDTPAQPSQRRSEKLFLDVSVQTGALGPSVADCLTIFGATMDSLMQILTSHAEDFSALQQDATLAWRRDAELRRAAHESEVTHHAGRIEESERRIRDAKAQLALLSAEVRQRDQQLEAAAAAAARKRVGTKKTQTTTSFFTNSSAQAGDALLREASFEQTVTSLDSTVSDWRRSLSDRLDRTRTGPQEVRQILDVLCDEIEATAVQLEGVSAASHQAELILWAHLESRELLQIERSAELTMLIRAFEGQRHVIIAAQARYDESAAAAGGFDHRSASEMTSPNNSFASDGALLGLKRRFSRSVTTDPSSLPLGATLPMPTSAETPLSQTPLAFAFVAFPTPRENNSAVADPEGAKPSLVPATTPTQMVVVVGEGQSSRDTSVVATPYSRHRTDSFGRVTSSASLITQSSGHQSHQWPASAGLSPTSTLNARTQRVSFFSTEDLSGGVSEVASVAPSAGPLPDYSAIDALL